MKNLKIIISVLLISLSNSAVSEEKMNACFITINSSEEKHQFKKSLSTGANAGKFEFHELAPDSNQHGWFENACSKNIRCDILVVSGHFGGSFFGESGLELKMRELETRSCKNDCKGIMSDPKEVFLLGCNTLAGKEEDNRSATEYLEVLLADDIPLDEASRIVEQRYGAVGTSFKDNMRRAFKGVPHIYGFHSIGPAGNTIERMLKNYHKDVPNYFDHLVKIELERGLALMNEFDQWNKKNEALARALRITHFAQTSGVLIPCSGMQGVSTDDPSYELLNNICKLRSDELSADEALEHIGELLLRDDFELYLSVISDFLDSHDLGDGFDKLISENPRIKANVIELLNKSKTGMGKIDIAKIARQMGIINKEEFSNIEKGVLVSYLAPPVSIGAKDTVCSYYGANKVKLTSEDLDQGVFEDFNALDALKCIGIHDQKLAHSVLSTAKMHKDKKMRMQALFTLSSLKVKDPKVEAFLNESLVSPKTQDEKLIAFTTAARLGLDSKKFWDTFDQFIKSDRKITWNGYTGTEREVAGDYFGDIKFKDYNDLKKYQDKFGNDLSSWPVAAALLKLEPREYMKFLKDPATSNQFEIRENFYDELVYSDRDDEIPYEIIPILIEDIQKRDASIDIYYVSAVTQRMKLSETQKSEFLNDVLNAPFSNEDLQYIAWNFPTQIKGESKTEFMMKLHQRDNSFFKSEVEQYVHGLQEVTAAEKEALRPLLSSDDIWLKMKLKELGVE